MQHHRDRTLSLSDDDTAALLAAAVVHPLHFLKLHGLAARIGLAMRAACPAPGQSWAKLMTVLVEPGGEVPEHAHRRHAVLFYPAGLSVSPVIVLPDGPYRPQPGEVLYLPPGVPHSVPAHATRRLSVAMLVDLERC